MKKILLLAVLFQACTKEYTNTTIVNSSVSHVTDTIGVNQWNWFSPNIYECRVIVPDNVISAFYSFGGNYQPANDTLSYSFGGGWMYIDWTGSQPSKTMNLQINYVK